MSIGQQVGGHTVNPNPLGWFDVVSSRSGNPYRVRPAAAGSAVIASCECRWFHQTGGLRGTCSHVKAVISFAQVVLEGK